MSQHARLFAAAALIAVLSACGAKGPLFLPEKPAEDQAPVAPAEAAPAPASDAPVDAPLPAQPPIDPATVPTTDGNG